MLYLRFGLVAAFLCGTAGAQETISGEGQPVKVIFDSPGHVTFDARPPNVIFPAPKEPRSFASEGALKQFLVTNLNGQVQPDGSVLTGATLIGDSGYPDRNGNWQDVGCDTVADFMVGRFGYFLLNGDKVALDRKACSGGATAALHRKSKVELTATASGCSTNGENCVRNETWVTNFLVIYAGRGTASFQGPSTLPVRCRFLPGVFPFFECIGGSRPNILEVNFALTNSAINTITLSRSLGAPSVDRIQEESVSWFHFGGSVVAQSPGTCGSSRSRVQSGFDFIPAFARSNERPDGSEGVRMRGLCIPAGF
jgi:hypothetical protein